MKKVIISSVALLLVILSVAGLVPNRKTYAIIGNKAIMDVMNDLKQRSKADGATPDSRAAETSPSIPESIDGSKTNIDESVTVSEGIAFNTQRQIDSVAQGEPVKASQTTPLPNLDSDKDKNTPKLNSEDLKNADQEYLFKALDLTRPVALRMSKMDQNFRLKNGNIKEVMLANPPLTGRAYNRDKGDGSANVMTCLFPSSSGRLNISGGCMNNFDQKCIPSVELIGDLIGFLYDYRNAKILDTKKSIKNRAKTLFDERCKDRVIKEEETKENRTLGDDEIKTIIDNRAATLTFLMHNLVYMIKNEEMDCTESPSSPPQGSSKDKQVKILPKYTAENLLLDFFIRKFSDESKLIDMLNHVFPLINYSKAKKEENKDKKPNKVDNKILEKIEMRIKLLSEFKQNPLVPYRDQLTSNESALCVNINENGNRVFTTQTFPDCADVAVLHVINMLSYGGPREQWKLILGEGENEEAIKGNVNTILTAMHRGEEIKLKLVDIVKAFFYYQKNEGKVNDTELNTRSFWNLIVSNMKVQGEKKKDSELVYDIKYHRENNELNAGYINMLKVMCNIAHVLGINTEDVEKSIGLLEAAITKVDNNIKEVFKKAAEDTFNLFLYKESEHDSDITCDCGEDIGPKECEVYGKTNINIIKEGKEFSFDINQDGGHASVNCNLFNKIKLEDSKEIKFLKTDEVLQPLCKYFSEKNKKRQNRFVTIKSPKTNSIFNSLFADLQLEEGFHAQEDYLNNLNILDLWISLSQGLDTDYEGKYDKMRKSPWLVNSDIDITIETKTQDSSGNVKKNTDTKRLSRFLFEKYFYFAISKKFSSIGLQENDKENCGLIVENDIFYLYKQSNANDDSVKLFLLCSSTGICGELKVQVPAVIGSIKDKKEKKEKKEKKVVDLEIVERVFQSNGYIKSFEIPKGIKTINIKKQAFDRCSINTFEIAKGLENLTIDEYAFFNCKSLNRFTIQAGVVDLTIGQFAFYECINLPKFTIPDNVKTLTIESAAFYTCERLEDFTIPEGIATVKIGECVFFNCKFTELKILSNIIDVEKNLAIDENDSDNIEKVLCYSKDVVQYLNNNKKKIFGKRCEKVDIILESVVLKPAG